MKREEGSGEEIKDIQFRRVFPCAVGRVEWSSSVTIDWPTIHGATAQQLYNTSLYLAQSFHYSLSTLKQLSGLMKSEKKRRQGDRWKSDRHTEEKKKAPKRERS